LNEEISMPKAKREISGLIKSAQKKSIKTLLRVNVTLKKMIEEKQIITFSQVAKQAQVTRAWLYKNDGIRSQIEAIREEQSNKEPLDLVVKNVKNKADQKIMVYQLQQRIKGLQKENSELREQIAVIYGKMIENKAK